MRIIHALWVVLLAAPVAQAQTFNFWNLTAPTTGSNFLPTSGVSGTCTSGDICSSNGGALTFSATGGISVAASGTYNGSSAIVVQDHYAAPETGAGLGVYHTINPINSSDDNVTFGEVLKLHFSQAVQLGSVGFNNDGHTATFASGQYFQYSLDGTNWTTKALAGSVNLNLTTQDIYFRTDGTSAVPTKDQFYVSSVVAAVPEPETYAMMLAGLGLMGAVVRRRSSAKQV